MLCVHAKLGSFQQAIPYTYVTEHGVGKGKLIIHVVVSNIASKTSKQMILHSAQEPIQVSRTNYLMKKIKLPATFICAPDPLRSSTPKFGNTFIDISTQSCENQHYTILKSKQLYSWNSMLFWYYFRCMC